MAIDIGRIAYQAYDDYINKNVPCHPLKWEDLGKVPQDAWRHAAVAVSQYLEECRKEMEEDNFDLDADKDAFE